MHGFAVFLVLGALGGFLSGLLGIGGALVMIPLMLEAPPLLGLPRLTMQEVSGLSMLQVFFAAVSGVIRHRKNRCVHVSLLTVLGTCMAVASLLGAVVSRFVYETALMTVFGAMCLGAVAMMLFPAPPTRETGGASDRVPFRKGAAASMGFGVGLLAGMVGAGGGFLLVPLMIYGLRISVKVTVGTSLGVVLIGSATGAIGKIATGQVVWIPAVGLIAGSVVMAQIGAMVSHKLSARTLRMLLLGILALSCAQIWREILLRFFV